MAIGRIKGFRYRDSLPRRPGWRCEIVTSVVEVCSRRGYSWFEAER